MALNSELVKSANWVKPKVKVFTFLFSEVMNFKFSEKISNLYASSSPLVFLLCSFFQATYFLKVDLFSDYKVTYSFP